MRSWFRRRRARKEALDRLRWQGDRGSSYGPDAVADYKARGAASKGFVEASSEF